MTEKTLQLIEKAAEILFRSNALLLEGVSGVGKSFIARRTAECLGRREYCTEDPPEVSEVITELLACHEGLSYEDAVAGIVPETHDGVVRYCSRERIIPTLLRKAEHDYRSGIRRKYVLKTFGFRY